MNWISGHPKKHAIVTHLLKFRIPSKDIVSIDSVVIEAIYGQHARKSARRRHYVKQFSLNKSLEPELRLLVYTAFETYKVQFDINSLDTYFKASSDIAKKIYNEVEMARSVGEGSFNTLLW